MSWSSLLVSKQLGGVIGGRARVIEVHSGSRRVGGWVGRWMSVGGWMDGRLGLVVNTHLRTIVIRRQDGSLVFPQSSPSIDG